MKTAPTSSGKCKVNRGDPITTARIQNTANTQCGQGCRAPFACSDAANVTIPSTFKNKGPACMTRAGSQVQQVGVPQVGVAQPPLPGSGK